ncbi:MAG TPA: SurA N-terminal domain-containing protein, partial [Beijerinckiaceae bacterium]
MLEGIRRASQNWLGKIVVAIMFGVLVVSFAIWGIGDIFRGISVGNVAKVGSQEISTETYRAAYQTQLQNWQRQARRAVTNDEARAAGLDRMVLQRLISEAALDQRAKELGLAMSEREIAQAIVNDPDFQGPTGRFDRQRFNDALREAGYPGEQRFIQEQRQAYLRRELALSLAGDIPVPRALLEAAHRYGAETRSVEYMTLDESFAGPAPQPTDEALKTFYEARKAQFRAPEYRRVVTLAVTPASVADPAKIGEDDARKAYEQMKTQRFTTAERREAQQIVFPTEEEAQAALEKIKGGASFEDIAKERGLSAADISLGMLAWRDFVDPQVAEAAFKTPEGEVSAPVKTNFGFTLVRVAKIEPQTVRPFEEVAGEVRAEVARSRARDQVQTIRDKIENERTSGKSLADAAKAVGLEARVIDGIDAQGRGRDGKPVEGLTDAETLLRAVYASDIGVDNDLLTTRDNGYVWF